jgi:hypothetical protein
VRNIVLTTIITASVIGGPATLAAASDLTNDAAECKRLGFVQGTASFLQCLQLAARNREQANAQAKAQAEAQAESDREQAQVEAERRAKCLALLSNPGPGMQGPPSIMSGYQQGYIAGSIQRWCR